MSRRPPEKPEAQDEEEQEVSAPESSPPATAPPAVVGNTPASLLQNKRIGIIGAGAMGSALCRGLINANAADPRRIVVSDVHADHVQNLHTALGIKVADN